MAELTQQKLEEMVAGKPVKPRATFFEKAALDVAASKLAGERTYRTTVYVKLVAPGVVDNISYPAQAADITDYREEYDYFLSTRQGAKTSVSIEIIPGLNITHKQELIDIGLSTIERLAGANAVPPHLEYARQAAIVFHKVLQEQTDVINEENNVKESDSEETNPGGIHDQRSKAIEGEVMPAPHRQSHNPDVGRPAVSARDRRGANGHTERREEAGRNNHHKGVEFKLPSTDWNISFG